MKEFYIRIFFPFFECDHDVLLSHLLSSLIKALWYSYMMISPINSWNTYLYIKLIADQSLFVCPSPPESTYYQSVALSFYTSFYLFRSNCHSFSILGNVACAEELINGGVQCDLRDNFGHKYVPTILLLLLNSGLIP